MYNSSTGLEIFSYVYIIFSDNYDQNQVIAAMSDHHAPVGIQEEELISPEFVTMSDVFEAVKTDEKPIIVALLGTKWSPPCKYTFQTAMAIRKEGKYSELVKMMFVDQDEDVHFCFGENIPVGFPTLLVFVNKYLVEFTERVQSFDNTKKSDAKTRLIRQLNKHQMQAVLDCAVDVYEEKTTAIALQNLDRKNE